MPMRTMRARLYTASSVQNELTRFTLPSTLGHLEEADSFFQHVSIHRFGLGGINIEQPRLASNRETQGWIILRCDNCNMDMYGAEDMQLPHKKPALGSGQMLVSMSCLCADREIKESQSHGEYSEVFKMVLKNAKVPDQLPKDVLEQPKWCLDLLTAMQQKLKKNLDDEKTATDDRIRRFSEKQKADLRKYQRRAERDKNVLYNLICQNLARRQLVPLNENELDKKAGQAVKLAVSYEPIIPGSLSAPAVRATQYMVHTKKESDNLITTQAKMNVRSQTRTHALTTTPQKLIQTKNQQRQEHEENEEMDFLESSPPSLVAPPAQALTSIQTNTNTHTPSSIAVPVGIHTSSSESEKSAGGGGGYKSNERLVFEQSNSTRSHSNANKDSQVSSRIHGTYAKHTSTNRSHAYTSTGSMSSSVHVSIPEKSESESTNLLGTSLPIDIPIRTRVIKTSFEIPNIEENNSDGQKVTDIARSMHAIVALNNEMYGGVSPPRTRKYSVL
eukprot:CFRG4278T1